MEQADEDTRSPPEVIIHTLSLVLTSVLALIGNSLVCFALYRNRRLRTITNAYVLSLAVADLIVGALLIPIGAVASGFGRWLFGYNFCQFAGFVTAFWGQLSTCTLGLASINRYFCVVRPHKYLHYFTRKKTVFSIAVVWVISFVLTLIFSAMPVVYQWTPNVLYCRGVGPDKRTERIFYILFGCLFIFPMFLLVFCYGRICRVIRQHNNSVAPSLQDANSQVTTAQEIKTCRVIFAAVFGFCVCWTPFIVILFLEYGLQVTVPSSVKPIYPLLGSYSAWINPIIYGVMNQAMQNEFLNILFCRHN